MDTMIPLSNFLNAFESALEQRKEDRKFAKFCKDNKIISLLTENPHEKQASELLTKYVLKKLRSSFLNAGHIEVRKITGK